MFFYLILFLLGLAAGSFLNVCVWRISRNLSVIKPSSFCPACEKKIYWRDNIPLLSYILLRGKCRHCAARISLVYPLVELATGLLTVLMAHRWIQEPCWLVVVLLLTYIFTVIAVMDWTTFMIADVLTYLAGLTGILFFWANPRFSGSAALKFVHCLGGILFGAFIVWLLAFLGKKIYKKEAMGEGDIFLMAAMGSFLGPEGVLTTIIMASFFGSLYAVFLIIFKKAGRFSYMPFGPFLCIGAVINLYSFVRISDFFIYL